MRKGLTPHLQPSAAVNGVTQLVTQRRLSLGGRELGFHAMLAPPGLEPRTMNFSILANDANFSHEGCCHNKVYGLVDGTPLLTLMQGWQLSKGGDSARCCLACLWSSCMSCCCSSCQVQGCGWGEGECQTSCMQTVSSFSPGVAGITVWVAVHVCCEYALLTCHWPVHVHFACMSCGVPSLLCPFCCPVCLALACSCRYSQASVPLTAELRLRHAFCIW
jgi:hypothetical protein